MDTGMYNKRSLPLEVPKKIILVAKQTDLEKKHVLSV